MKIDLNENEIMLASLLVLAGTIAAIAFKQLEILNITAQQQAIQYIPYHQNVPVINTQPPYTPPPPPAQPAPLRIAEHISEPRTIENTTPSVERAQESGTADLSPVTHLGYNSEDDLVAVMKRMPNGEVMRRKIRDPDMSLENLQVDRWVEYKDWEKEHEMDWI